MNTSEEIYAPPSDCDNSGSIWTTGRLLFDYIRKQKLENGATGHVAFDDHGDRVHAEYDMVNVRAQGEHVAVGKYFYSKVSTSSGIVLSLLVGTKTVWSQSPKNITHDYRKHKRCA